MATGSLKSVWQRVSNGVRMAYVYMIGAPLFALKMKLAFRWIGQQGLSVFKVVVVGNTTYVEDPNGTRYRLRKG